MPFPFTLKVTQTLSKRAGTVLGIFFMLYTGLLFGIFEFPHYFINAPYFNQQNYSIFGVLFFTILTGVICLLTTWRFRRKLSVFFQSNLLLLYVMIFYLRLNSPLLNLAGYQVNSAVLIIPLLAVVFLVNRNLFNQNKNHTYILVLQIFLIALSTFSLLSLLDVENTNSLEFSRNFLYNFFDLPDFLWLTLSSGSIALLSVLNLKLKKYREVIIFTLLLTVLNTQISIILNVLSLTYWYKTLFFIVFWDFVYHPLNSIIHYEVSTRFYPKFIISLGYHILLCVFILWASTNIIN